METEIYQQHILDKRYEIGRKMYNSLVNVTQKRYKEMVKTKRYRTIQNRMRELKGSTSKAFINERNELYKDLRELYIEFGMNEYAFHSDIKFMQRHFKKNIDSFTAQKITSQLWKSYEKLLFGKGEKVHYKRYGQLNTFEGKSNKTGITLENLKKHGAVLTKIDTWNAKVSQFDHIGGSYKKKKLSQRWTVLSDGIRVQRDMYSAFLIMNINRDFKSFNLKKCDNGFDKFKIMHDNEVCRLSNNKNLSSMVI